MGKNQVQNIQYKKLASHEVIKHSGSIHISNTLTCTQRKVVNVLLKNAYKNLLKTKIHQIKTSDLMQAIGCKTRNLKALKNIIKKLNKTQLEWNVLGKDKKNKEWGVSTMLASGRINSEVCKYEYSNWLCEMFSNPNIYGRLNLIVQKQFRGGHALAIWEFLVEFLCSNKYKTGFTEWLTVEQYRNLLGVQNKPYYQEFKHVSQDLIHEPLKEINAVSEINAVAVYRREKRRVKEIRFEVSRKDNYQPPEDVTLPAILTDGTNGHMEVNVINNDDLFKRLKKFGLAEEQAIDSMGKHEESYIIENLDIVEKTMKVKQIDNLSAYTMASLRDDYRTKKSQLELEKEVKMAVIEIQTKEKIKEEKIMEELDKTFIREISNKTDDIYKSYSESGKEALFKEFREGSNNFIKKRIGKKGVKDLTILDRADFDDFLSKKFLKPEDTDFIFWGKRNGYEIQKNGYGSGSEKYIFKKSV